MSTYMMMVMAATPSSPMYFSMARLKSSVVMPDTREVASSDRPLVEARNSTSPRKTGFSKWSSWSRRRNTQTPTAAVMEYPRPVAAAAPRIPSPRGAMST